MKEMILPYGDTTNDGAIQLSFTLPIAPEDRAREAAREIVRVWGFSDIKVAHMSRLGGGYTYFVVFAKTDKAIDYSTIQVPKLAENKRNYKEIDQEILKKIGRAIRIVGACTGFDAHTVGLDAILNMKGFDGDVGLERYKGFQVTNMGSQIPADKLIDCALKENADAILVSKIVTQKDIHLSDLKEVIEKLYKRGLQKKFILVAGGPRVTHQLATEVGFDAGFTIGTRPSDVANFILEQMLLRKEKEPK